MQREIDRLTDSLRQFVTQPNYPTLVLVGTDAGVVFPHRILAAFDRQDDDAYYLLFPQPCPSPEQYFEQVLAAL
ncbi:MAG TPA: hypothetical protein VMG12_06080, partial [Polyangiaceae bacterium]|nr:hypothetical protein [Polyangiaceae bacterium]